MEGKYICFKLGEEEFGVPILNVQEIIKPVRPTKLPEMPDYMLGMLNLRGRIIPVISLKKRMSMDRLQTQDSRLKTTDSSLKSQVSSLESQVCSGESKIVVINMGRFTCGGFVDNITGVVEVKESDIKERDIDSHGEHVMAIATVDGKRILQLLNLSSILLGVNNLLVEDEVVEQEIAEDGRVVVSKKVSSMGGEYIVKEVRDQLIEETAAKGGDVGSLTEVMERIQCFLQSLSSGKLDEAEQILSEIYISGEKELFAEVGKITRNLHNALVDFKQIIDPKIKNMALEEIPEASDKLNWVITKTEEAAGKTISLVEKNLSFQPDMIKRLDLLDNKLKDKKGDGEGREAVKFLRGALEGMNADFMDIIIAQEFQDLTGQIIKKVILLVAELEERLVELIRVFGVKIEPQKACPELVSGSGKGKTLTGPQIKESEGVLASQEDVDVLLKEFGF